MTDRELQAETAAMTESRFTTLERLYAEATPGPWVTQHNEIDEATIGAPDVPEMSGEGCLAVLGEGGEEDADLIVALHNAWPQIAALIEAARHYSDVHAAEASPWENAVCEAVRALVEPTDG